MLHFHSLAIIDDNRTFTKYYVAKIFEAKNCTTRYIFCFYLRYFKLDTRIFSATFTVLFSLEKPLSHGIKSTSN